MSFVLVPSPYEQIPETLKAAVPEFAQSEDYRLGGKMEDLPGVVLASFARFLATIVNNKVTGPLEAGVDVIDRLCASDDHRIDAAMEEEFFATLSEYPDAIAAIVPMMGKPSRDAYHRWLSKEG